MSNKDKRQRIAELNERREETIEQYYKLNPWNITSKKARRKAENVLLKLRGIESRLRRLGAKLPSMKEIYEATLESDAKQGANIRMC